MQPETFTLSWLAAQLKRDRRALGTALEGLTPDEEKPHSNGVERRWYLHRVVAHLIARESSADGEEDQRQRLAAAQAERYEMENEERRGQLVNATDARTVWSEHIGAARAKFLSMPTKLGPQLINVADPNVIASRIRIEVYAALDELADWKHDGGDRAMRVGGQGMAQPADSDCQPVG